MHTSKIDKQADESLLKRYVPLSTWLPRYQRKWLRADLLAGITVWGTTVPTAMGYAQVAGLPIQAGLYAAMVGLIAYAIFGTSSLLKVETSPSMAIMSAAIIAPIALGNYAYYITLSAALALTVGLILIVAGFARMGFLADFLAKPIVYGFIFGLALIVIIRQIPSLFGLEAGSGTALNQLVAFFTSLREINLPTLAISLISFLVLILFQRSFKRFPGTLIVLALSTLAVWAFNLEALGVDTVGDIPTGLPALEFPIVRPSDILSLLLGGTAMAFVALGESLGTARTLAAEHHNRIDANQELLALGAANLGAGLFQGFTVGANPSTTSATNSARSKTQIASMITAAILMVTLATHHDFFAFIPQAVVAVAVISSASHLMYSGHLRRFYHERKTDFMLAMVALIGVLVTGILPGLLIAVFLSLLIVLYRTSQPHLAVLGKITGHDAYGDIKENPDAKQIPGLLIVRPDVLLFFANAGTMHSHIRDLISTSTTPIKALIVDLSASEDLDIAVTDMLKNLVEELNEDGIRPVLTDAKPATRSRLERTGLLEQIGETNLYLNVREAVEDMMNIRKEK